MCIFILGISCHGQKKNIDHFFLTALVIQFVYHRFLEYHDPTIGESVLYEIHIIQWKLVLFMGPELYEIHIFQWKLVPFIGPDFYEIHIIQRRPVLFMAQSHIIENRVARVGKNYFDRVSRKVSFIKKSDSRKME